MKSPVDDEKFIYRRNFSVKQAPSAEVIYNYAIQTQRSTANSKENPTQNLREILGPKFFSSEIFLKSEKFSRSSENPVKYFRVLLIRPSFSFSLKNNFNAFMLFCSL